MNDPGSTRQVAIPQLSPLDPTRHFISAPSGSASAGQSSDAGPSFQPASQAQIIRAHQRDSAQVHRLTELASEIVRSFAGTRWLAHKQTIIDLSVRAAYLMLTFGRGMQTIGEEYTDVLPFRNASKLAQRGRPGRTRRIITILFLLFPSLLTSPSFLAFLRSPATSSSNTALLHDRHRHPHHLDSSSAVRPSLSDRLKRLWHLSSILKWRHRLADLIESPLGQSMPELHMVAFLYGGRFFEWGRRLTGMGYISTLPPSNRKTTSFEPLALLLAIPLIFRLLPRRSLSTELTDSTPRAVSKALDPSLDPDIELDTSSHLHPAAGTSSPDQTADAAGGSILVGPKMLYDTPNTYLLSSAQELPERQCTLCLEPRGTGEGSGGTVGVTECGHVFCWGCLGGLEKLECPLCRQSLRMERLIAAYNL